MKQVQSGGTLPQQGNKGRANSPLPWKKKCKGSVLATQVGNLQPLQGSCASISTEKAVQDRSANLTTSVHTAQCFTIGHGA